MFEDADLIDRSSRADALRDGVLIDASALAREAGFKFPVALTAAVGAKCVAVPSGVLCQDQAGRLWDVVWLLACAIRRGSAGRRRRGPVRRRATGPGTRQSSGRSRPERAAAASTVSGS
jgi:hypothetical protein